MSEPVAGINEDEFSNLFLEQKDFGGNIQMIKDSSKSGPDKGDVPFSKQHGMFAGLRVWLDADDNPVWRVVDIRFTFPSAEKANLYHKARLQSNSEGRPLIVDAPKVGQDCHVFGGSEPNPFSPDMIMVGYSYVFQVYNVVIKLFIMQGPAVINTKLDLPTAASLAKKIELRIKAQAS
jgi:hypothetical protein